MCCFSAPTEVYGTSIFARFTKPGTQSLVYQMRYAATQPTAMILPLPVGLPAREDSVRFKSLKDYPQFFEDLASGFPNLPSWSLSRSKSVEMPSAAVLEVHDVGDFIASFVPSVADFARVDPRFAIAKEVWAKIPAYADYGFAVFQLKELSGSPHPIALEYDSRSADALFFPTVHIHDGSVHEMDQFDHVLYAQAAELDGRVGSYQGPDHVDEKTGFVRSKERAALFADAPRTLGIVDAALLVHKSTLRGTLPNRDTTFSVLPTAASRTASCGRCDVGAARGGEGASLPLTATLAAIGWIICRRDARRSNR